MDRVEDICIIEDSVGCVSVMVKLSESIDVGVTVNKLDSVSSASEV
jgi:hypothetical protein